MADIKKPQETISLQNIQQKMFRTQLILIVTLALFLGAAGTLINIRFDTQHRDQNLKNVAEAIAQSPMITVIQGDSDAEDSAVFIEYLDSLRDTLEDIDVISVVSSEQLRLYHSSHDLIGTVYDGSLPDFEQNNRPYYAVSESGPSGTQRRAYAAIYDENGSYTGFVMAIMLMKNIRIKTLHTLWCFVLITLAAILTELFISAELSGRIKQSLLGYEPDVFTAMYRIRDNILESLDEGVIAVDKHGMVQFANDAAAEILNHEDIAGKPLASLPNGNMLLRTLEGGDKEFHIQMPSAGNADILLDRIPVRENDSVIGTVGILHNRTEYTRLMEDLTGTRYLVDSMRANNHDFTNKLHVILGLIQMDMVDEAVSYIENISMVQRENISAVMHAVDEPAVAALLIGKTARASELNIRFVLREGCRYVRSDYPLPGETLITVIGNLIENAFEAMNEASGGYDAPNELMFGIFSRPGALLITVDDTGSGIAESDMERIFENGFSTRGEGRGTGLYQVKTMVENLGGTITVESQKDAGTSFAVSFTKGEKTECTGF